MSTNTHKRKRALGEDALPGKLSRSSGHGANQILADLLDELTPLYPVLVNLVLEYELPSVCWMGTDYLLDSSGEREWLRRPPVRLISADRCSMIVGNAVETRNGCRDGHRFDPLYTITNLFSQPIFRLRDFGLFLQISGITMTTWTDDVVAALLGDSVHNPYRVMSHDDNGYTIDWKAPDVSARLSLSVDLCRLERVVSARATEYKSIVALYERGDMKSCCELSSGKIRFWGDKLHITADLREISISTGRAGSFWHLTSAGLTCLYEAAWDPLPVDVQRLAMCLLDWTEYLGLGELSRRLADKLRLLGPDAVVLRDDMGIDFVQFVNTVQ